MLIHATETRPSKETGHTDKCDRRGPTLSGVDTGGRGGGIEDTTYMTNIIDKISLALRCELTQKYSASKRQHCLINKESEV